MLKALYLFSEKTGRKRSQKFQKKIIDKLSTIFNLSYKLVNSLDDLITESKNCYPKFDVLIVAGGDGTLNSVISTLCSIKKESRPILGYIPTGTINDAGKGFGVKGRVRQALKILQKQEIIEIDTCVANKKVFSYVCAIGRYADISYITKRNKKKCLGRLSYYFVAIKQALKIKNIHAAVDADGTIYEVKTPFVLVMNGPSVGGFSINSKTSMYDGVIDVYLTKPGVFNGLLHYLFFKFRTTHIQAKNIKISTNLQEPWCFDGEKGISGNLEIEVLPQNLKVFGHKISAKI